MEPIQFEETDFERGHRPPLLEWHTPEGQGNPTLPPWAYHHIRTLTQERSGRLWSSYDEVFGPGGVAKGPFRERSIVTAAPTSSAGEAAWLNRQIELSGTDLQSACFVLYDSSSDYGITLSFRILLSLYAECTRTVGDFIVAPVSRDWSLYSYHHGQLTFTRMD